jgi:GABA(A) receptor-associated protein
MTSFEQEHELEMRIQEAKRIKDKYPDRIPVIVEKAKGSSGDLAEIDKRKFLVPQDLTMGQLVFVVRKRIKADPNIGIFLYVNKILPATDSSLSKLYEEHKSQDGFLYITYSGENTFG